MSLVFLVPTLNEEKGIGRVINIIKALKIKYGYILVVDGNSKDRTREIAKKKGAKVLLQKSKGKGGGMHEAIATLKDNDIVVMVDGDDTYDLTKVPEMLKLVDKNTVVTGQRIPTRGSLTYLNKFGNFCFNTMTSVLYLKRVKDMLTGLRAFYVKTYRSLELKALNFEIETEMTINCLKKRVKVVEVPIKYTRRAGSTNLDPLKDGYRILRRVLLNFL